MKVFMKLQYITAKVIYQTDELVFPNSTYSSDRVIRRSPWHLHVFFAGVPSGLWLAAVCSGGSLSRSQLSRTWGPNGALLHVQTLSAPPHSLFRSRSHAPTTPLEWLPRLLNWTINLKNLCEEFLLALLKSVCTATSLQSLLLTVSLSPSGAVSGSLDLYWILIPGRRSINPTYFIPSEFRGAIICEHDEIKFPYIFTAWCLFVNIVFCFSISSVSLVVFFL